MKTKTTAYPLRLPVPLKAAASRLSKQGRKMDIRKWKGYCKDSFMDLRICSVDEFIEDLRGR